MKRIRFVRSVQYECFGRRAGPTFEVDEDYELPDDFADRWLRRGDAVMAPEKVEAPDE